MPPPPCWPASAEAPSCWALCRACAGRPSFSQSHDVIRCLSLSRGLGGRPHGWDSLLGLSESRVTFKAPDDVPLVHLSRGPNLPAGRHLRGQATCPAGQRLGGCKRRHRRPGSPHSSHHSWFLAVETANLTGQTMVGQSPSSGATENRLWADSGSWRREVSRGQAQVQS